MASRGCEATELVAGSRTARWPNASGRELTIPPCSGQQGGSGTTSGREPNPNSAPYWPPALELCPAIGSGAALKGHGGPTVTGDQGAMAALRGRGAEKRWIDA